MSFQPSPGSIVRMDKEDGDIAIVTKVVPDGKHDSVFMLTGLKKHCVVPLGFDDIYEIIWEQE